MATAPECCGFAPHWVQNGVFEAGKGAPVAPPSPPPLFPVFWLESLLPPPQALIAATAITIRQLCLLRFMGWTSNGCGPQLREFIYSEKHTRVADASGRFHPYIRLVGHCTGTCKD